MSRIAAVAEQHWRKHRPMAHGALHDPHAFFQALAEQAEDEIEALAEHLAGTGHPSETFMEKVSR